MRTLLAAALLALALPAAPAPAAPAPAAPLVEFRMDPRFELIAAVQLLGGAERAGSGFFRHDIPYDRAVEAWFKPYARHPAVARVAELSNAGFDYVTLYHFVFSLGPLPDLAMPDDPPADMAAKAGGLEKLRELQLLLADFAKVSRFSEFYGSQAAAREELVALAAAPVRGQDLAGTYRAYTGRAPAARVTMLVSPFAEPVLSAIFHTKDPDGTPRLTVLYGPETYRRKFVFRTQTRFAGIWLELAGLELTAGARPYADRLRRDESLYAPVARDCAPSWYDCAQREIAFAVGARMLARQGFSEMADLWPGKYARMGMPHLAPLVARLKEYEQDRAKYPTLLDFYPRLLDVFDSLAAKGAPPPPFFGRFGESWSAPGPAVLILPGAEGERGAALIAAARALAERRRPGFAEMTDEAALKADLKGRTVIAVGTLTGNRWLARRWEDLRLPARLSPDRLAFSARPGEDRREVFSGRLGYATTALNPDDGVSAAIVYTGADADAALAALDADPGLNDYAVLDGTAPLKVGLYEKSFLPWRLK